jgi:foldase protein PrsA
VMRPALATGVFAALVASGCSSTARQAATVAGTDVTIDDYESVLQEVVANPQVFGVDEDTSTGTVAADPGRQVLTLMIQSAASEDFLSQAGEEVTDEDRQAVRDDAGEDSPLFELSDDLQSLFVDLDAGAAARARIAAPDAAELERRYNASPEDLGVVCVRHVVVETEAEADAVLDEINQGAAIEDLAVERSIDPAAAENGGALENAGSGCISITSALQATDPAFLAAAVTSSPGEPAGPVQTSFGWHVIEARPYDEIADDLSALFDESAGDLLYAGFLSTADVQVDPRYGRWDGASASVIALS